ncbi:hypothetical protein JCM10207_006468 [Rhodosporidiobolus poonsookiae]
MSDLPPAPAPVHTESMPHPAAPLDHKQESLPPSSSLPTPPTTHSYSSIPSPPAHPTDPQPLPLESAGQAPAPSLPPPAPTPLPPAPANALPSHLDIPHKLVHQDSSSSVAVQPPTPLAAAQPPAAAPPQFTPEPAPLPTQQANGHLPLQPAPPQPAQEQAQPQPSPLDEVAPPASLPLAAPEVHTNGFHEHDHPVEVPVGAHPGLGALPHEDDQSAVDVLADVAMGEAALGLADFAAGAGSADVRGGSPALGGEADAHEYSPSLKRSADEADGGLMNGYINGVEVEDEREIKRLKVDGPVEPSPAPLGSVDAGSPYSLEPPAVVAPPQTAVAPSLPPSQASPAPPAVSPSPAAVQGYDPSAFTNAPTLASSAPPYPPSLAAPTISPSDLLNMQGGSPLIAPPSTIAAAGSPLATPSAPTPAAPQPPQYASPEAFLQQPHASTSTAVAGGAPQPLGGGEGQLDDGAVKPDEDAEGEPEPPAPTPINVMTKDQQKFAINMVRNLKRNKHAGPFLKPVDAVALHIPDYYKIITHPMDLGTVEARLQSTGKGMAAALKVGRIYGLDYSNGTDPDAKWEGEVSPDPSDAPSYRTIDEFKADMDRVWENCFRYNGQRDKNPVSNMAGIMMDAANKSFRNCPFAPAVSPYPPPPQPKLEHVPSAPFIPSIGRGSDRPKREIHAPAKDLPYLESAGLGDPTAGGIYNLAGLPGYGGAQAAPAPKQRKTSAKAAQEQLRFCKEVVKEMFKKVHEAYAYPFYQPVDVNAYPTYLQYVKKPMDLSTIRHKLEHAQYPSPPYGAFEHDMRLIFKNCYAFNPPGTVVNGWGHQLEAVFEHKWAQRPMLEDFDDSEDDGLTAMEQQLHMLQANIEAMKANKKAQREQQRYAQLQARQAAAMSMPPMPPMPPMVSMPKPPKPKPQPQPNPYAMSAYASAPPPMPRHGSGGSHKKGGGGGPGVVNRGGAHTHKKKKKRHDDDSDDYYEDDGGAYYGGGGYGGGGGGGGGGSRRGAAAQPEMEEYVDFEMKRELAVKIVTFDGDQLEEAINIIRRGRPELLGAANQEIELDIDQLDQYTLLNLYRFVCPDSKPAVRPVTNPSGGRAGGNKANKQRAGNARKNLDEEKEAERIEMLEARLREFENGGAGDASRRGSESGAVPGPGGDDAGDQASSDSSDEASSDSDSDED